MSFHAEGVPQYLGLSTCAVKVKWPSVGHVRDEGFIVFFGFRNKRSGLQFKRPVVQGTCCLEVQHTGSSFVEHAQFQSICRV